MRLYSCKIYAFAEQIMKLLKPSVIDFPGNYYHSTLYSLREPIPTRWQ